MTSRRVYDVTSRIQYTYTVRLCALRNSTERVSALPGLPETGRDPSLRTLGRRISMPRVTQVPSVSVEAHALRRHTSARRVERKCEPMRFKTWPTCTSTWAGRVIAPLTFQVDGGVYGMD